MYCIENEKKTFAVYGSVVQCENMNDAEQLTWLLVNHIEEVVSLSSEPPVQELIAAVHRNPTASGLLVQAVGVRCRKLRQV
jgi:huntingtin